MLLHLQPTHDLEPFAPLEKNGGVAPQTAKGDDLHLPMTISLIPWISTVRISRPEPQYHNEPFHQHHCWLSHETRWHRIGWGFEHEGR